MFPIAHAWLVSQLIPAPTDAHLLGCVWPDMLFTSPLDHVRSHRSGHLLVQHAASLPQTPVGQTFRQFVVGVLTHGSEPHGFDWYSDEAYGEGGEPERGYAFQRGRPLADAAARACGLPHENGWWKAHNIVEMAFESSLWSEDRSLGEGLARACADERLLDGVSRVLAEVFSAPQAGLSEAIRRFPEVVAFRPENATTLAEVYARQTRLKHPGADPEVKQLAQLIEQAQASIRDSKDEFLAGCVERVGAMLREVVPW